MTTTTSNYGLFKYVSSSDANLAFNITSALNNNWDKLDTYAVRRSSTGSVGTTQTPVYVNSSGVITACSYSIPTSTGLTATVSLSENGYIKFSNSILIQFGYAANTSDYTMQVNLPIAFTNTSYTTIATHWNISSSTTAPIRINVRTVTSVTLKGSDSKSVSAYFLAIGY